MNSWCDFSFLCRISALRIKKRLGTKPTCSTTQSEMVTSRGTLRSFSLTPMVIQLLDSVLMSQLERFISASSKNTSSKSPPCEIYQKFIHIFNQIVWDIFDINGKQAWNFWCDCLFGLRNGDCAVKLLVFDWTDDEVSWISKPRNDSSDGNLFSSNFCIQLEFSRTIYHFKNISFLQSISSWENFCLYMRLNKEQFSAKVIQVSGIVFILL